MNTGIPFDQCFVHTSVSFLQYDSYMLQPVEMQKPAINVNVECIGYYNKLW